MPYTITEALQEIKTINKRLEAKRKSVHEYLVRDARAKDPLEREGGSAKFIAEARQAISDLEDRVVAIRTSIQQSNLATKFALGGKTRSVAEWLTWRREVATGSNGFVAQMVNGIQKIRADIQKQGGRMVNATSEQQAQPGEVLVHVEERDLLKEHEEREAVMSELDGKLSLLNATTTVTI